MAIPDYQTVMLPLLKLTSDGKEHQIREAVNTLADQFKLTEAQRKETLPSGGGIFDNRVGWARTYLKKAGLLSYPKRTHFQITDRPHAAKSLRRSTCSSCVSFQSSSSFRLRREKTMSQFLSMRTRIRARHQRNCWHLVISSFASNSSLTC